MVMDQRTRKANLEHALEQEIMREAYLWMDKRNNRHLPSFTLHAAHTSSQDNYLCWNLKYDEAEVRVVFDWNKDRPLWVGIRPGADHIEARKARDVARIFSSLSWFVRHLRRDLVRFLTVYDVMEA